MSETTMATQKYSLEQWAAIIRERINSGKPVKEWCKERGISRGSYYYYLPKVKDAAAKEKHQTNMEQTPKIVPILPPPPVIEIDCIETATAAIVLKINDITMEIQNCASEAIIERILKALKHIC